jgi:hypothetical protein
MKLNASNFDSRVLEEFFENGRADLFEWYCVSKWGMTGEREANLKLM